MGARNKTASSSIFTIVPLFHRLRHFFHLRGLCIGLSSFCDDRGYFPSYYFPLIPLGLAQFCVETLIPNQEGVGAWVKGRGYGGENMV